MPIVASIALIDIFGEAPDSDDATPKLLSSFTPVSFFNLSGLYNILLVDLVNKYTIVHTFKITPFPMLSLKLALIILISQMMQVYFEFLHHNI
jgi:hypothetical protein